MRTVFLLMLGTLIMSGLGLRFYPTERPLAFVFFFFALIFLSAILGGGFLGWY